MIGGLGLEQSVVYEQMVINLIEHLEGGRADIKGDSGGLTHFGLSSRYYPEFVREAEESADARALFDKAVAIYTKDYIESVYGHEWLAKHFPELLWLLFSGKVHGSGDEEYTEFLQRQLNEVRVPRGQLPLVPDGQFGPATLRAVKGLTEVERTGLLHLLTSPGARSVLAWLRVRSVQRGGAVGVERGIANRVKKELDLALAYRRDAGNNNIRWVQEGPYEVRYAALSDSAVRSS